MRLVRSLAVLAALFTAPAAGHAHHGPRPRIVFFSPNSENNSYWPQVFRIIEEVARDLDFEFVPYSFGVKDRFARESDALRVLSEEPRPDAAIASIVIGHTRRILEAAERQDTPIFILGPLFPSELPGVGGAPRRKYTSWSALLSWAEETKGYALGKVLLEQAERAGAHAADGKIHVVGLGGDPSWFGSGLRRAGLARAVAEHPHAVLEQVVPTKWTPREGKELTFKLLRRFPDASVVWAASDQLGAGAVEALTELGRELGRTAFTGGLDLSDLGLGLVRDGKFVASAASSLLSYAQTAVLVYDYLHGHDFGAQLGNEIEFPTYVATRDNVEQHLTLSKCIESIDFAKFSRVHNAALERYDFSLEAYTRAAQECITRQAAEQNAALSAQGR